MWDGRVLTSLSRADLAGACAVIVWIFGMILTFAAADPAVRTAGLGLWATGLVVACACTAVGLREDGRWRR